MTILIRNDIFVLIDQIISGIHVPSDGALREAKAILCAGTCLQKGERS